MAGSRLAQRSRKVLVYHLCSVATVVGDQHAVGVQELDLLLLLLQVLRLLLPGGRGGSCHLRRAAAHFVLLGEKESKITMGMIDFMICEYGCA